MFEAVIRGSNMDGGNKTRNFPQLLLTMVIGRRPRWTLTRLAILILGTWFVFSYVLTLIRVTGISMLPTYHDGQINVVYRLAYSHSDPQRGDVVGVRFKETASDHFIFLKRIVGGPGDKVAFVRGKLFVNDEPVSEPYVKNNCDWNMPPRQLGLDEYYVVGDNREMAFVDHTQGVARRQQIVGRVVFHGNS